MTLNPGFNFHCDFPGLEPFPLMHVLVHTSYLAGHTPALRKTLLVMHRESRSMLNPQLQRVRHCKERESQDNKGSGTRSPAAIITLSG